ncbi:MAG: lipid droplet-associated protein [Actinomycetota bacterium]|nr:lipid droplet-associated protein [Actinomycetota bacterium]
MPNSLPFPLRVVAGLLATGVETIRRLPADLPGMGVEVAGAVTKAALQVRQRLTELAIRGDELLDSGREPQEHPAWARFDDDDAAGDDAAGNVTIDDEPDDEGTATAGSGPAAPAVTVPAGTTAEPLPLAGYDAMTVAQVRGHLRTLTVDDLRQLLRHEESSGDRPPYLTMLRNRITTLEHR